MSAEMLRTHPSALRISQTGSCFDIQFVHLEPVFANVRDLTLLV